MVDEKLVPKLRFAGFDDKWGEVKLDEIFDIKNGLNKGFIIHWIDKFLIDDSHYLYF